MTLKRRMCCWVYGHLPFRRRVFDIPRFGESVDPAASIAQPGHAPYFLSIDAVE